MKRLLALALTLILAFSLSIPALAASDDYWNGYYDGMGEGYDAGYADYEAGKTPAYPSADSYDGGHGDGYVQGYISGYETAQWDHEIYDSPDYDRGYEDGYADALAGETGYPDEYWENEAYEYGYDDGYYDGVNDRGSTAAGSQMTIADFGGIIGGVNVMLNGECINFGDVWPENHNGHVLAPVRAVLEALGAQVDYDLATRTVTAALDGNLLIHRVGTATVEVYKDGDTAAEPKIITMDCTSEISGGRTLVPVRFFSEALGFQVYWDGYYHAVVLLDTDALAAEYEDSLTVVNLLLANAAANQKEDTYYHQTADVNLDVTVFDTLNGDTELGGSAKVDGICGQEGQEFTVKLDLRKLFDALEKKYGNDAYMRELAAMLEQAELDIRFDAATEQMYIGGSLLETATGLDGAWYQEDLSGGSGWAYGEKTTAAVMAVRMAVSNDNISPLYYYAAADSILSEMKRMLGDDQFTRSGSTYTLHSTEQDGPMRQELRDLLWNFGAYGYSNQESASLDLTVTDKGNGTCSYQLNVKLRTDDMALELAAGGSASSASVTCKLHARNIFEAMLTVNASTQTTSQKPETVPKDLEASLELGELPNFM